MKENWELLTLVVGEIQAELILGLLKAQGINVNAIQEGAGRAFGLGVGPLGEIEIRVPTSQLAKAQDILARYESGELAASTFEEISGDQETDQEID